VPAPPDQAAPRPPWHNAAVPLHAQARSLLDLVESLGDPPIEECTPNQARLIRMARQLPPTAPIHETRDLVADGVPCRLYRPNDDTTLGLLVYFHGGGWVLGDLDSHDQVCRILANGSGHAVLSVGYRLAPEHPYPAAVDDAVAATRWAYGHAEQLGCRADRLAVGGDSAGGNLAAVVAQLAPIPLTFQLLIYPVTDCTQQQPSYEQNGEGYFLTRHGMSWFIDHYLSGNDGSPKDARVSPLFGADHVLASSPPALVITAEFDPLRDEGDAYARRLAELGVPTSHVTFQGMFHGFFSLADYLDDAKSAHAVAASALATAFAR
jgi:acetyl esterase